MAPGDAWKKKLTADEQLKVLRIALDDARIGFSNTIQSVPKPQPKTRSERDTTISRVNDQAKRPGTNNNGAIFDHDTDSDCERMMKCTTDLTGQIAEQEAAAKNGSRKPTAKAIKLDMKTLMPLGLKRSDKVDDDWSFISWRFLVRYAELYVGKTNTSLVEPYFDEKQIFQNHVWDFFYMYEPEDLDAEPIYFVPSFQLETLLEKINQKFGIALKIPDCAHDKFYHKFDLIQPRYLARTTPDGISFRALLASIPLPDAEDEVKYRHASQTEQEEFATSLKRIKDAWATKKGDEKGKSKKKREIKRLDSRKSAGHATKRVQRYLGLRQKIAPVRSWEEASFNQSEMAGPALDLADPVPFDFENDVVFICFDIETYERAPKLVTEIGYAILDTRDIRGIGPGTDGTGWFPYIQARHFRVKEYKHYRNRNFVRGNPEFFQFGLSEIIGIESIRDACFKAMTPKSPSGDYRRIVLVGHDVAQDIDLILTIDLDVYDLPGLLEIVDNQRMQQHRRRLSNPPGLGAVLADLNIPHVYLHNGGNDAVYTLQSMLCHAVRTRVSSLAKSINRPCEELGNSHPIINADVGWSTGGEDTDGGEVPPQVDPLAMAKGKSLRPTKTM